MSTVATSTTKQPYGKSYGGNAAENYERFFVPVIGEPLAQDLVAKAALRPGERVLDVACGTGIVTRLAADRVAPGGSVAALDITPAMLATARTIVMDKSVPIRWYETTAESIPLPDASFDVVLCQLGLMFIPDKRAAVREMARVLAPGGRIFITVPTPTDFFNVFDDTLAQHVGPEAAQFVKMVFSLNDPAELEALLRGAGLQDVRVQSAAKQIRLPSGEEFVWQYVQSTPLMALLADATDELRAAIERAVVSGWERWQSGSGLAYDQPILTASGRK